MPSSSGASVADFTVHVLARDSTSDPAAALFAAVSHLPYATDAAHTARGLLEVGSGNCAAKSDLLAQALTNIGTPVRVVRWSYRLPDITEAVCALPSPLDLHTALQVRREGRWVLADPTIDDGLAGLLPIASWDLKEDSTTAFPPRSPVWVLPEDADRVQTAIHQLQSQWQQLPAGQRDDVGQRYLEQFNATLRKHRADHCLILCEAARRTVPL